MFSIMLSNYLKKKQIKRWAAIKKDKSKEKIHTKVCTKILVLTAEAVKYWRKRNYYVVIERKIIVMRRNCYVVTERKNNNKKEPLRGNWKKK